MKKQVLFFAAAMLMLCLNATAQVKPKPAVKKTVSKTTVKKPAVKKTVAAANKVAGPRVKITTDLGVIVVRLYDSTPLHRDNFVKLVKQHFYDSLLFHRVIEGFMIQGGDPQSKHAEPGERLGSGGGDMPRIPAEIKTTLYHKRGVLAAARDGNPQKASSACQFYIVQGKKLTDPEISMYEAQNGRKYSSVQRMVLKEKGGTIMLDGNYTVFGEVESGLDVIDKIAAVQKDPNDRPFTDIRMKMELVSER